MLDARTTDLVNRSLDESLSAAEQQELDSLLADSSEARELRDGLSGVASLLASTPPAEPPLDLESRILRGVSLPPRRAWFTWSAGWMQGKAVSYAAGAAAGLVAAIAFYELSPKPVDLSSLVGTITYVEHSEGPDDIAELQIDRPAVVGRVNVDAREDYTILRFDVDSDERVDFEIQLGDSHYEFGGFAQEPSSQAAEVNLSGSGLVISNRGPQSFAIILRDVRGANTSQGGIKVSVKQGGESLFEGSVTP